MGKGDYTMKKLFILTFCCWAKICMAQNIVNYENHAQYELNNHDSSVKTVVVDDDFSDLDLIAAKHGDVHAMGTLANSCLRKADYICAYKWAGIALRGNYWQAVGAEDKIKDIMKSAEQQLSAEQTATLQKEINEFSPR